MCMLSALPGHVLEDGLILLGRSKDFEAARQEPQLSRLNVNKILDDKVEGETQLEEVIASPFGSYVASFSPPFHPMEGLRDIFDEG